MATRATREAWRAGGRPPGADAAPAVHLPLPTPGAPAPPQPALPAPAEPVDGGHLAPAGSLADLLAHSPDIVLHLDADGRVVGGNTCAAHQLPAALQPGVPLRRLAAPGEWVRWLRQLRPALAVRGVWAGETRLRIEGQPRPFALTALARRDDAGRLCGCTAVLRDLSADHLAHQQAQRQNQILSAITEALPATVVIVDSQGRYRYVNSAFERYAGRPADQILGRTAGEVLGADEVARRRPFMKQAFAGEPVEFVLDYPTPEGTTWLALSCLPIKLDGVFDGFVGISQDITMQRREQERLARLAERDPLTGLLKRAGFEQRVQAQRALAEGAELALLYIDLDPFKAINDSLGHAAGDQVLQGVARRLRRAVRATDLVCRLGGDEFAILLTGTCDRVFARKVGDKVLAAVARPFALDGQACHIPGRQQATVDSHPRARIGRPRAGPWLAAPGQRPMAAQHTALRCAPHKPELTALCHLLQQHAASVIADTQTDIDTDTDGGKAPGCPWCIADELAAFGVGGVRANGLPRRWLLRRCNACRAWHARRCGPGGSRWRSCAASLHYAPGPKASGGSRPSAATRPGASGRHWPLTRLPTLPPMVHTVVGVTA